jgi:hypothetical protein
MSLDKIVIIVLALLFFGGILLVALKNRQQKSGQDQTAVSPIVPKSEDGVSTFQPQENERRKSKI